MSSDIEEGSTLASAAAPGVATPSPSAKRNGVKPMGRIAVPGTPLTAAGIGMIVAGGTFNVCYQTGGQRPRPTHRRSPRSPLSASFTYETLGAGSAHRDSGPGRRRLGYGDPCHLTREGEGEGLFRLRRSQFSVPELLTRGFRAGGVSWLQDCVAALCDLCEPLLSG